MNKSYYAIIPANVRYDKDLAPNAKLLYGEITALCNEKGYCWATNSYFSELYNVKNETISRWISQLIKRNYLSSEIFYRQGTKEIEKRHLYIGGIPIDKKINTSCENNHKGIDKKINTPIDEKVKENNTVINNTFNNSKYVDKEPSNKLKEFSILYQQNIGVINGITGQWIIEISEKIDVLLFKRAIEICTEKGNLNQGYLKGIIKNWTDMNITTYEQYKANKLQKKSKKEVKSDVRGRERDTETESSKYDTESEESRRRELLEACRRAARE